MADAKTFFDRYAYDFDAIYGAPAHIFSRVINPLFRKSMMLRYEKTMGAAYPIIGKSVLDVGCGPGHYAVALAQAGAQSVVGIDFAPEMIHIARKRSEDAGMAAKCTFLETDIMEYMPSDKFSYSILMGFMDYIAQPEAVIARVIQMTNEKIMFSFPVAGGVLAFQRKIRYRKRCPLFLYTLNDLRILFSRFQSYPCRIEKISRDYFVTLTLSGETM